MLQRRWWWPWGLYTLTRGLAVDHQDVGHLSKLNTGGVLFNFLQEFSKDHLTPTNEQRRKETAHAARARGASTSGAISAVLCGTHLSDGHFSEAGGG